MRGNAPFPRGDRLFLKSLELGEENIVIDPSALQDSGYLFRSEGIEFQIKNGRRRLASEMGPKTRQGLALC